MTPTPGTRLIGPEDLLALDVITDAQLVPDGSRVAYTVKHADLERNEYRSAIFLVSTDGGSAPRQITSGTHRDSAPRWSPDGRELAFVSDRSGTSQIYLLDLAGGEPRQLTDLPRGATDPVWSPDGTRLAFVSSQGNGVDDGPRDQPGGMIRHVSRPVYRFDAAGFIDDRFQHVWVVAVDGGAPVQVTRGEQDDLLPAWSPDGSRIAFIANRQSAVHPTFRSQLYVVPALPAAPEGDGARLISRGAQQVAALAWSPDGTRLAYIGLRDGAPTGGNDNIFVAVTDGDTESRNITAGFDRSPGVGLFSDTWSAADARATLFWSPDGAAVVFTAADEGRVSLFRATLTGDVMRVVAGDRAIGMVTASADGWRLAYVASDFVTPCDLYVSAGDGSTERRLTTLKAALLAELTPQQPEYLPFTSYDGGFRVDAWLIRPAGYQPGQRYPLVQIIHGGPHSVFGYIFFFDMQQWASHGWNVLFVNPRATQGYGEAFATANLGDWGGGDWREQEMALELAIERGGVDPERLAVTGLSYGGFMTNWIIGQTDRYRAAVSENGICNLVSFFGTSDIGWYWLEDEWGGRDVWGHLDFYMAHSPISYVPRMRTPTLLLQAETDWRCPIEQGEQLYAALRARDVPCEMVRFPGESHACLRIGKPQSRLERRRHTLRWLERYL